MGQVVQEALIEDIEQGSNLNDDHESIVINEILPFLDGLVLQNPA